MGCTWCAGDALTNCPCKLRLKFFLRPGGAGAPTAPPDYAYAHDDTFIDLFEILYNFSDFF